MAHFKIKIERELTLKEAGEDVYYICRKLNESSPESTRYKVDISFFDSIPIAIADFLLLSEEELNEPRIRKALEKKAIDLFSGESVLLFENKIFDLVAWFQEDGMELNFEIKKEILVNNLDLKSLHISVYYKALWNALNERFEGSELEVSYISYSDCVAAAIVIEKNKDLDGASPVDLVSSTVLHYTLKKGAPFPKDWNVAKEK